MFATSTLARNVAATAGAALIAAAFLGAAVAPAAAADAPATKTVSYADLNLGSPQGRTALENRIKSAARTVCQTGGNDLVSRAAERRCYRHAVSVTVS